MPLLPSGPPRLRNKRQSLTIGELEANYPLYCKALRMLLQAGKPLATIQRTLCWSRLESLHTCLPNRYKDPDYLCTVFKRDLG